MLLFRRQEPGRPPPPEQEVTASNGAETGGVLVQAGRRIAPCRNLPNLCHAETRVTSAPLTRGRS